MGGGTMRTAGKIAAGYRPVGASSSRAAAAAAGGRFLRTPSATGLPAGSAVEAPLSISIASSDKGLQEVAPLSTVQRPSWELDDWEFAEPVGEEAAVALDSRYQAPRLVFGCVPTLAEAREAISDLKDALDTVYPSRVGSAEEAACESTERVSSSLVSSMPGCVRQTFSLLQRNPEVQTVVASIASDKNVWDAMMKNEKLVELCRTHTPILSSESDVTTALVPATEVDDDSTNAKATAALIFTDFVRNVKAKVVEVLSGLSNFIQDFFDALTSNDKIGGEADKPFPQKPPGEVLMALTIATILVVLVNRG